MKKGDPHENGSLWCQSSSLPGDSFPGTSLSFECVAGLRPHGVTIVGRARLDSGDGDVPDA
jgi:hypothetical protein